MIELSEIFVDEEGILCERVGNWIYPIHLGLAQIGNEIIFY